MPDHAIPHPDLAGYALGALEPEEADEFEAHLAGCGTCRAELRELGSLHALLAKTPPQLQIPAGLETRTFAAIERERRAGTRRTRLRVLAVAGAVAALVVLGGVVLPQMTGTRPSPAAIALVAADGENASGVLRLNDTPSGVAVDLEVEGLPPTPPGRHYELWFVGAGDSLDKPNRISAGTFIVPSDGKAKLRAVVAADLERRTTIGVTDEPDDGNPARTGPKLLAAPAPPGQQSRLTARLRPEQEVIVPGPPGAEGTATIEVDDQAGELCYTLTYAGIGEPAHAHIHSGPKGAADRPIAVDLRVLENGNRACVAADRAVLQAIAAAPSDYFLNIHTHDYPKGAIRGQLTPTAP